VSSKPQKPKSSEEPPADTSSLKKRGRDKPKRHGGQVQASVPTQGLRKANLLLQDQRQDVKDGAELTKILLIQDPQERSHQLAAFMYSHYLWDLYKVAPLSHMLADRKGILGESALDFCQVIDEYREIMRDPEGNFYSTPPHPTIDKGFSIQLFPVHICISPLASERDVLDYVAKNWRKIRTLLDSHHKGPRVIRRRKKEERDQYIWENRDVPSRDLAEMVNLKFPGEPLEYYEIDSIKHYLKKRHTRR
jgi:hypothetical protein